MKKVLTNLKSKLKKVSKESLAIFAVIATTLGLMGYAIVNASDAPEHHKNVASNHDGTYKISLDVTGDANTEKPDAKANILVIYDVSGSMNNDESYTYAEKNTGRYGKVNNNVVDLYYVSGTNWQGNPQYSQVNSDTYTGDVYTRSGGYGYYTYTKYTGKRYWRVKRSQASEKIIYDFADALYKKNKNARSEINGGKSFEKNYYKIFFFLLLKS